MATGNILINGRTNLFQLFAQNMRIFFRFYKFAPSHWVLPSKKTIKISPQCTEEEKKSQKEKNNTRRWRRNTKSTYDQRSFNFYIWECACACACAQRWLTPKPNVNGRIFKYYSLFFSLLTTFLFFLFLFRSTQIKCLTTKWALAMCSSSLSSSSSYCFLFCLSHLFHSLNFIIIRSSR